jgi:hypothetical protein
MARESSGLLPSGMKALIFLFEDQFISYETGKIWAVPREGLG